MNRNAHSSDMKYGDLDLLFLLEHYRKNQLDPIEVIEEVISRVKKKTCSAEWIYLEPEERLRDRANTLKSFDRSLPLYGIPFSIKDNINVKGMPTAAGCTAFSFYPDNTSSVVTRLLDMGGILIGKNTMDEFATGVVGVRSDPHPVNPFDEEYICGGSSSGSGVVVAKKCVSFSLGSDTGGSGRVPAALCNVVGFKPTPHVLSNDNMIYANRSIDCIPIFSKTVSEAKYVFEAVLSTTASRKKTYANSAQDSPSIFANARIAIPRAEDLKFFGDETSQKSFSDVVEVLRELGSIVVEIDFDPFVKAGNMLFEGAYLNERYTSVGPFIKSHSDQVNPVVADIICSAEFTLQSEIWGDIYKLNEYRILAEETMRSVDILLTPTTGTIYKIEELNQDPIRLNQNMAYYTNFGNLLDLSIVSVPAYFRTDGLPFGISFMAPMLGDDTVLEFAAAWEAISEITPGC